jgi:hypothetical protein
VRVVHFAGKNVKPWVWKNYPLHGWITLWHSYASQVRARHSSPSKCPQMPSLTWSSGLARSLAWSPCRGTHFTWEYRLSSCW